MAVATLYYVHDPMCSWCWGFHPMWQALKQALPTNIEIVNVTGGLAPDSDVPMPEAMQQHIAGYWRDIQAQLGTEFNFDFWTSNQPRRSTYMSCRATIAAAAQWRDLPGGLSERQWQDKMIEAIGRAYYLRAMNPSDVPVLVQIAVELGLDATCFESDLLSAQTQTELERQLTLARQLPIDGFPSLVLQRDNNLFKVERDYHNHLSMLGAIEALVD